MFSKGNTLISAINVGLTKVINIFSKGLDILFRRNTVVLNQNTFNVSASNVPVQTLILTHDRTLLLTLDNFTFPDFVSTRTINTMPSGSNRQTILTFDVSNNINTTPRTEDIILIIQGMANIAITVNQPGAAVITGAQFTIRTSIAPTFNVNADNVGTEGVSGSQITLWVFSDGTSTTRFQLSGLPGQILIGDNASGVAIDNTTFYTISQGVTAFAIDMFVLPGANQEIAARNFTINPDDGFNTQASVAVVNHIDRSSALQATLQTVLGGIVPIPGDDFQVEFEVAGAVGDITYSLFPTAADRTAGTNELIVPTTQSGTTFTTTVAIPAGVNGAARTTTFFGRVAEVADDEEVVDVQVSVTSSALTFVVLVPSVDWNASSVSVEFVGTRTAFVAIPNITPNGLSIGNFSLTTTNVSGSPSVSTAIARATGTFNINATATYVAPNRDPSASDAVQLTLVYTYRSGFGGLDAASVVVRTTTITRTARPRVPMTVIDSGTTDFNSSDFNATATVKLALDTGAQLEFTTVAGSPQAQYPTVNTASTINWIEDDEMVPSNSALIADVTNTLRSDITFDELVELRTKTDLGSLATPDQILILESGLSAIVNFSPTDLSGYVSTYTLNLFTHDSTDPVTQTDGLGRNTASTPRQSPVTLICNTRPSS